MGDSSACRKGVPIAIAPPGPGANSGRIQVADHLETLDGLRHSQFLTALIVLAGVDQLSSLMHLLDRRIDGHHSQDDGDLDAGDFRSARRVAVPF